MLQSFKKITSLFRLILTIISCTMHALYAGYICYLINNDIGSALANTIFLVIALISFALQILLYLRLVKGRTSRNIKRLCRIAKLLTNIFALGTAIYTSVANASIFSFLMLPIWFAQLIIELIFGLVGRFFEKRKDPIRISGGKKPK